MVDTSYFVIAIVVQFYVIFFHHRRLCKGVITRAWRKVVRVNPFGAFGPAAWRVIFQYCPLIPVTMFLLGEPYAYRIQMLWLIALYLDDWLFGDDDANKRRKEALKNKVKWLWTPSMEPARSWNG